MILYNRSGNQIYDAVNSSNFVEALVEACSLKADLTSLSGSNQGVISNKDFSNGILRNADFTGTTFSDCIFNNVDFSDISGSNATHDPSEKLILDGVLENCTFKNANFSNVRIGSSKYVGGTYNFLDCDFINTKFDGCEFIGIYDTAIIKNLFDKCTFQNINFSDLKIYPNISISTLDASLTSFNDCDLINCNFSNINFQTFYESRGNIGLRFRFYGCTLNRINFQNIKIVGDSENPFYGICDLQQCDFSYSILNSISNLIPLTNCLFDFADLTSCSFQNNSLMSGCSFNESNLTNTNFSYSNLSNSYFSKCIFEKTIFYKTTLINASIIESYLSDLASYIYLNLSGADLSNSTLNNMELATVILNGADLSNASMGGVIYSSINSEAENNALFELAKAEAVTASDIILLNNEYKLVEGDIQAESNAEQTYYQSKENYDNYFSDTSATINRGTGMQGVVDALGVARGQAWNTYSNVNGISSPVYKLRTYNDFTNVKGQHEDQISRTKTYWETNDIKGKIVERERLKGIYGGDWQNWKNLEDALDKILKPYKSLEAKLEDDNEIVLYWRQEVIKANETASNRIYANFEGVNLTDVDLSNSDMSYVNLKNTNLTNTKMQNVTFDYAKLYDADLSNKALVGCSFVGTSLSGAMFLNYSQTNISFSGADLYQASFINSNLQNNNFSRAILKGASFNNVVLSGADGPDFSYADLSDTEMSSLNFAYNTKFNRTILSGANLSESDLTYTLLVNANLSETNLSNSKIENSYFDKCIMIGVDLSESKMDYTKFDGSNMSNSYMYGVDANYCSFKGCIISASDLRKSSFDKSDFRESLMMESDIRDCYFHTNNFTDADLSMVKAFKSNFYYPVLTRTKLTFLENQKLNLMRTS